MKNHEIKWTGNHCEHSFTCVQNLCERMRESRNLCDFTLNELSLCVNPYQDINLRQIACTRQNDVNNFFVLQIFYISKKLKSLGPGCSKGGHHQSTDKLPSSR